MFGFKRRARERAAAQAKEMADMMAAVYNKLAGEIWDIAETSINGSFMETDSGRDEVKHQVAVANAARFTENAVALTIGAKAALLWGGDPYGPDLAGEPRYIGAGACLGRAAFNVIYMANSMPSGHSHVYADFYRLLRDLSEHDPERGPDALARDADIRRHGRDALPPGATDVQQKIADALRDYETAQHRSAAEKEFNGAEYERASMSWRGYEYGCALRNAKQIAEQIGHRRGLEEGQTAADVTNKLTERSVKDWADSMIAEFTKGAAVKAIFCDEDPEREVQFSLAEFNQAVDDHLGQIKPDVRAKLSAYEQLSRESDALDERFDSLQHNLTTSAIEIAQCVVLARKEEMGLRVEEGPHLTNGRRILEEVRAMPVSLNDQQKETLKTCLQLLDQGTS